LSAKQSFMHLLENMYWDQCSPALCTLADEQQWQGWWCHETYFLGVENKHWTKNFKFIL
jgi:hypothetical protein